MINLCACVGAVRMHVRFSKGLDLQMMKGMAWKESGQASEKAFLYHWPRQFGSATSFPGVEH